MARHLRTNGNRPKCWVGAAIGAGASILQSTIGGFLNSNKEKAAARAARMEAEHRQAVDYANMQTQQNALMQNAQKAYEEQYRLPLRRGGRARLRSAVGITDGGYAIPLDNNTFLLRGGTHEQVNESGKTGIGINVGGKEVEAENGELVDVNNNDVRVFSNTLPIPVMTEDGITYTTPSKAVLAGYNKNKIFAEQQAMNGNSHGSKAVYGSEWDRQRREDMERYHTKEESDVLMTPSLFFNRSKSGNNNATGLKSNKMGASWGTADWIGLGTNVLGSILSQTINKRGLSSLRQYAPTRPVPYIAGKLITNYNINPQLSNLERSRQQAYESINKDTASSIAALDRRNNINVNTTLAENELYDKKYQTEAEMLNKDTLNQQEIANKNVEAYNSWRDAYNKYMGTIAGGRAESNVAMIQGIGNSIGNFLQQGIDRRQLELNRQAYLATADKGNEMILNRYGILTPKEQEAMLVDAINRKDWNAANYWRNYVSPRRLRRISLKYA